MQYIGPEEFVSDDISQNVRLIEYGQTVPALTQTDDTGTTIFDTDGNYALKILGKDSNGQIVAKKYKLVDMTNTTASIVGEIPKIPTFQNIDGTNISLDFWTEKFQGRQMYNSSNYNWETIQTALTILLSNQVKIQKYLSDLSTYFINNFESANSNLENSMNNIINDLLQENYYSKDEVSDKIINLEEEINDLKNIIDRINLTSGGSVGTFPPSYVGDKDVRDTDDVISDTTVKDKIENMMKE